MTKEVRTLNATVDPMLIRAREIYDSRADYRPQRHGRMRFDLYSSALAIFTMPACWLMWRVTRLRYADAGRPCSRAKAHVTRDAVATHPTVARIMAETIIATCIELRVNEHTAYQ